MSPVSALVIVCGLGLVGWAAGRAKARLHLQAGTARPHSLPAYHGWYVAIWTILPPALFLVAWGALAPGLITDAVLRTPPAAELPTAAIDRAGILSEARRIGTEGQATAFNPLSARLAPEYAAATHRYNLYGAALALVLAFAGGAFAFTRVRPDFRARTRVERLAMGGLLFASLIAILTTIGIVASLLFESIRFFGMVSPIGFLFGTGWSPQQVAFSDPDAIFGAVPLFWGTIFIGAIIAMIVAIPLGLMSAIYLTQYAAPRVRAWMKPVLEILAGVPTVVYGYFAALTVAPAVRDFAASIGIVSATSESALAAGLVMGVMIIPFVSSMADDSIAAVPQAMRDGSLAMGATTSETIRRVLVPAALPGIVAGVMLAISRAIGETMIVVMAASTAANLSANPLEAMTTVTVQIVAMLTGEGSFDHPATLSAFALGFVLFMVTLALNFIALRVVKRFREAYE